MYSFLLSTSAALASVCGEQAVFVNGRAVMGWQGALVAYLFLFWMIPGFTLMAAFAVYLSRRMGPWLRAKLSRLAFWRRR